MSNKRYVKVDKDVLIEWTFNDQNLITEDYKILVPDGNTVKSYAFSQSAITFNLPSKTNNLLKNQLFSIDPINRKFGKLNDNIYTFLHIQDFKASIPIAYDTVKFWFPINFNFKDKIGMYVKIYSYDYNNLEFIELSNFYYDKTDQSMSSIIDFPSQSLNIQEILWGKCIELQIPSVYELSRQRSSTSTLQGSINSNITGGISGVGLSQTSPIFIDFSFIDKKETIMGNDSFFISAPFNTNVPQSPEFKSLGINIKESDNGDFFEIVGTFNDNSSDFNKFINDMANIGQVYYIQYDINLFEENISQTTEKRLITSNFSEPIEYRPIIKRSNTTAAIQVTMNLINLVDDTQISRIASIGLLRDQISKYGSRLLRINTSNTFKPKIYNNNNVDIYSNKIDNLNISSNKFVEKIEVPFPAIALEGNIVIQNKSEETKKGTYYGKGLLNIPIRPFDNIIKFSVAKKIQEGTNSPYDLTGSNQLKLIFKGKAENIEIDLYYNSGMINLELGILVFKIDENKVSKLQTLYENGENQFYITTSNNGIKTTLYDGRFMPDNSEEYKRFIISEENKKTIANSTSNLNTIISKPINKLSNRLIKAPNITISRGSKSIIVKKLDLKKIKNL